MTRPMLLLAGMALALSCDVVIEDRCRNVVCLSPPQGRCEGNMSVSYGWLGTCDDDNGVCEYSEIRRRCGGVVPLCHLGQCLDKLPDEPDGASDTAEWP